MRYVDPTALKVVAWDFDGVLNRNVDQGVFLWSKTFERDLGLSLQSFREYLFQGRFQQTMVGQGCLREMVTDWCGLNGAEGRTEEILDYWFRTDAATDDETLAIVSALRGRGVGHVMATNNEVLRTDFIETEMGFGQHMDRIFAAGRMKIAKPDLAYFEHIETELGVEAGQMLLVDDMAENVLAARSRGWQAFHFTPGSHRALAEALAL